MKKFSAMFVLSLFLFDGTGQILNGFGQIVSGPFNGINKVTVESARWAGHYEYVTEGNDASGMASTG